MKIDETSDVVKLRFILLPDEKMSSAAVSLANEYSKLGKTYFVVDGKNLIPHITVCYGEFPTKIEQKAINVMENINYKYNQINLDYKNIECLEDWLMVEYKLNGKLKQLHKEMVIKLSLLGKIHPYSAPENYHPHLTLLRYKENIKMSNDEFVNIAEGYILNAKCSYLAVAYGEENGVVSKIIRRVKLN